ncbi:hypothetical protein GR223_23420 [Rhizobium leguminosarum]|uniref:hypothetical protein n=1 Tax=Rhizobium ruizarguesonis TaxID=2081791 RepID=UPI0013DFE6B8|nr:hypothetical protein [Rhizobium ruizarguesonis]NEJ88847.1 hypothetical protein [Rhizobium ruizarguesonis]
MQTEEIETRFQAIEAVIAQLPEDYQPFGFFLRLSGARTEKSLSLTVGDIENAFSDGYKADLHSKFLVEHLGGALSASAVDYLLKYVVTSRKAILQRLSIDPARAPRQVFIDKNGRPLEGANVSTAFRNASARSGQVPPIGPRDIRQAVVAAYAAALTDRELIITLAQSEADSGAFAEET